MSESRIVNVNDQVLKDLMDNCYHEIALSYEDFVSLLPLDKLSAAAISDILPTTSFEDPKQDSFWSKVKRVLEGTSSESAIFTNTKV